MKKCKSVLVVEDRADTRDAMRALLEMAGYWVACAANGREALDYLYRAAPPGVILLDLKMPVMDGWQFREEQRRDPDLAGIAVILTSSATDLPQVADSLGAAGYQPKPIDFDRLLEAIQQFGA
jgi:CheY-like chemotaxis protein